MRVYPPMWLVDDEELQVVGTCNRKRVKVTVRVQVWRVKDEPAVVLVTEIEGAGKPSMASAKIADRVWRDLLKFNPLGMIYHEFESDNLWQVTFEMIGHPPRGHMTKPIHTFRFPAKFNALIGRPHFTLDETDRQLAA